MATTRKRPQITGKNDRTGRADIRNPNDPPMVSLGLCFTNNRQVGKIRQIPKGSSRKNLFKR
jgi:hypothetical protein